MLEFDYMNEDYELVDLNKGKWRLRNENR